MKYFELTAKIALSGDALADAMKIAALQDHIETFISTIETAGGTVTTRIATTQGARKAAAIPVVRAVAAE